MSSIVTCDWCGETLTTAGESSERDSYSTVGVKGNTGRWTAGWIGHYHDDNGGYDEESCFEKMWGVFKLAASWAPTLEGLLTASGQKIAKLRQKHRVRPPAPPEADGQLDIRAELEAAKRELQEIRRGLEQRGGTTPQRTSPEWVIEAKKTWAVTQAPGGIGHLRLSDATFDALRRDKVLTVEELRAMSDDELFEIRRIGPKRINEIRDALDRYDGRLG